VEPHQRSRGFYLCGMLTAMSRQIPLKLAHPLRYSSDSFIVHDGAVPAVDGVMRLASAPHFSLVYIRGDQGAGKTHLGVYLAGRSQEASLPVRFLAASQVAQWCVEDLPREPIRGREALIIDDADTFLASETRGGVFGALAERFRAGRGVIVLVGTKPLDAVQTGVTNLSLLEAAVSLEIGLPDDAARSTILGAILEQRGRRLSATKRALALKQEPRSLLTLVRFVDALESR